VDTRAPQWVSCFQGILLTAVGWVLGIASLLWAGGPAKIEELLKTQTFIPPGGNSTGIPLDSYLIQPSTVKDLAYPWVDWVGVTASILMFLLMATGFPHNIARFLGTRKISKREYWTMLLIAVVGGLTPLWIGVVGFAGRAVFGDILITDRYKPMYGDARRRPCQHKRWRRAFGCFVRRRGFRRFSSHPCGYGFDNGYKHYPRPNPQREANHFPKKSSVAYTTHANSIHSHSPMVGFNGYAASFIRFYGGFSCRPSWNILLCCRSFHALAEGYKMGRSLIYSLRLGFNDFTSKCLRTVCWTLPLGILGVAAHFRLCSFLLPRKPPNQTHFKRRA